MGYKKIVITLITNFPENQSSPSFTGGKGRKTVGKKVKTIPRKLSTGLATMLIQIVMKTVMKKAKMRMKTKMIAITTMKMMMKLNIIILMGYIH